VPSSGYIGALGGNRTPDSGLRTPQLYPLSYEGTKKRMKDRNRAPLTSGPVPLSLIRSVLNFLGASGSLVRPKGLEPLAYRSATCRSIR
jgi:hypothetical protein